MVVREDGTKWACSSCLKGHRVSGCTHTDRELTLVPKKGRPVTQCQHCRLERKKRSAHVKCDCAEEQKPHHSKEKCIHLREAEERAKAGFHDDKPAATEDSHHLAAVAEEQGCCCGHGGKCTCSIIKKESQTKDGSSPPHGPAVHKPRLETTRSDGSITVFANGHHKPVHKRNHAAHESGMPYKMPMPRHHSEQSTATQARRSVDSLALDTNMTWNPAGLSFPNGLPMSKSEQPSPRQNAAGSCNGGLTDAKLSSIDFSTLGPVQTNQSMESIVSEPTSMFPAFDPMSGLADATYDPWSTYPSTDSNMPDNNPFGVWATNFDTSSVAQPALTAASSGTQSEIDEIPNVDDMQGFFMPSIAEEADTNRRSLPPNFFGNIDFSVPNLTSSDQTKNDQLSDNVWNTPTMPAMTMGRPTSHSVGPGNAPSEDIIKQLFPDFDFSGFNGGNSPAPASEPKNVGPMDESMGFSTTQPWSDGSLSMPSDAFSSSYLEQDFAASQDFWGSGPFQ